MSFRRRGDVISGRGPVPSNPMLNRVPGARPGSVMPARGVVPNRIIKADTGDRRIPAATEVAAVPSGDFSKNEGFKHPGVKPSSVLSNISCISTGTKDIDTILVHGGLPTNTSLLIEEDGSTDFSGVLIKKFVAEGIVQNRRTGKLINHCIVIGMDSTFGNELPDVYAGNRKERKKKLVKEQEGKLSVSNINAGNELKIAWRYRKDIADATSNMNTAIRELDESKYPEYNHQFDLTTSIRPSPDSSEITYIPLDNYENVLDSVKRTVERELKNGDKMIRIAVPYMLNPMIYGCDDLIDFDSVAAFIFNLRRIINSHEGRLSMVASMSSELYEDTVLLSKLEELLFDGIIRLVPFPHELNVLMEKVYKTQREKIKQGYVDIYRVPIVSSMGLMEKRLKEYSFKNSKTNFHVEQWSIPVEEEEVDDKSTDF